MDWTLNNRQLLICHKIKPNLSSIEVLVRVPCKGQINLFKNYSYLIGPCTKKTLKKWLLSCQQNLRSTNLVLKESTQQEIELFNK